MHLDRINRAPKGNQLYLLNRLSYRPLPYIFGNGRKFPKSCGDVSPVSHPFRRAWTKEGSFCQVAIGCIDWVIFTLNILLTKMNLHNIANMHNEMVNFY